MPGLEYRAGQCRAVPISRRRDAKHDVWLPNRVGDRILWLRATSLELDGLADGDAVTTWCDESGQGNNVTQTTTDKKPLFKVDIISGKPAVRFDGTDDWMGRTTLVGGDASQPNTIIAIAKFDNADTNNRFICDGTDAAKRQAIYTSSGSWRLYAGTGLGGSADDSSWHVFVVLFNGASSVLRIDGSEDASGDAGDHVLGGLVLGAAQGGASNWDGDIAEIFVYDGDKTSDFPLFERYAAIEYGITLA